MTHLLPIRVYYEDTDAGGIVYHARYLAFAERARTEAMREGGAAHDELATQHGLIFVVRRVEMDYWRPARLDDVVVVATDTVALGGASIVVRQAFSVGDDSVGMLQVKLACIRRSDGRPARIPDRWRAAFERRAGTGGQEGE
jgi:acyl-CoA thioester hydrolase